MLDANVADVPNQKISKVSKERIAKIDNLKHKYWKSWSSVWNVLSIFILVIAYFENKLLASQESVNNDTYSWFLIAYIVYLIISYGLGLVKNSSIRIYSGHFAQLNVSLGLLLIVQDLLTEKFAVLELPFFPGFAQILDQINTDHQLLIESTWSSLKLWLISFVIGTLIGVALGIFIGRYRQFNYWSFPYLKVIGIIPAAAWMPITMVIFPTSYLAEIFLIAFSVWFPVAFMTIGGVQSISNDYFEAAKTLGLSEFGILRKIVIPGALPNIFVGIFTALGLSFTTLVISEMIGAKVGLGWYINWSKGVGNYTQTYAAIVIMAILFSIIFSLINKTQSYVLRWRDSSN